MNRQPEFTPELLRREANIHASLEFEYTDMCLILCCKANTKIFITDGWMFGLDDLGGLFQPMILRLI